MFVLFRLGEVSAIRIIVPSVQYPAALSQNEVRLRTATPLGNPVGGFLFDLGRTVPFLADAASYVASLATLLLIRAWFEEVRRDEAQPMLGDILEGIRWLWNQHYILIVNTAASVTSGFIQVAILVVIVAERNRGASASVIGLVLGGFGAGGVAGSLGGGWRAERQERASATIPSASRTLSAEPAYLAS